MPAMPRAGFGVFAGLVAAGVASGQEAPPLVTDRPDQTESAAVVPVGAFQFEVGARFAQAGSGAARLKALSIPGSLLRIGIFPLFEARLGFAGWLRSSQSGTGPVSGMGDLDLGGKVRVLTGDGLSPAVALLAAVVLPTGQDGFGTVRADPAVRVAFSHGLTERISLGYNVGAMWGSVDGGAGATKTDTDLLYTVVLGSALTSRLSGFIEGFGTVATETVNASTHSLDGGFTFLVTATVQLDASGGFGLNEAADDWFGGIGLSLRVPR
ncbi:MAG TPA: transporter [Gemmatimonadales bacterium]